MAFPNVPNVPGVPALPRDPGVLIETGLLILADAVGLFPGFAGPTWGLFLDGDPVVIAESVVSFEFRQGYTISNFQVEKGGFESYNKVQRPFDVRLRFATGDTVQSRTELLASAQAACASLDLMDAVTPEKVYESVNPISFDYRRTAVNGVGLIIVDIFCEQVRATASSTFTNAAGTSSTGLTTSDTRTDISVRPAAAIVNPQSPSASPQASNGTVQPFTPSAAQQASIDNVLSSSMLPF